MSTFDDSEFHEQQALDDAAKWGASTRASIVAFLDTKRVEHERAHAEHIATRRSVVAHRQREYDDKMLRLDAYASLLRTLIANIRSGADLVPQ